MATPGSIQLNMSASALRASSRMHEEETIASMQIDNYVVLLSIFLSILSVKVWYMGDFITI